MAGSLKQRTPNSIIITGASSGIGAALAVAYSASGITLGLTGRNKARLEAVADKCRAKGAVVRCHVGDIQDFQVIKTWMEEYDSLHPVDLVIANAGISAGVADHKLPENIDQIQEVFKINLEAAIFSAQVLIEPMIGRGHGQVAFMSSMAGFKGWPGAPAYCASKAGLRVYAQALQGLLHSKNIAINIICPGFVSSAMTDKNKFFMPFKISSERAARIIKKELGKNRKVILFPATMRALLFLFRVLPDSIIYLGAQNIRGKDTL